VAVTGFIDSHMHFRKTNALEVWLEQLLDWLTDYTFPLKIVLRHRLYASAIRDVFLRQLYRTAHDLGPMVYSSVA